MKSLLFYFFFITSVYATWSQVRFEQEKPKLVVGIVVDQMRYDYLTRFYQKYGEDGFKKIIHQGFNCENAHFNYIPTYTAVGHASIYTGTTPAVHGIISNDWYDKELKKSIYCVDDSNYSGVGTQSGGNKSPARLLTTTVTDELRLAQNNRGKVIGISIKDRSAILPVGHTASAAYWIESKNDGKFSTSSFYMETLPDWVVDFNNRKLPEKYINQKWETLHPIESYTESIADDNAYEQSFTGQEKAVFPYDLKALSAQNGGYDVLKSTPFGNTLLFEFAKSAVQHEKLGKGEFTDFLAISFSSPDYIGHQFGVDSKEIEDTYLRLDKELGEFLFFLDKTLGKNNYTLFMTADHAAVQVPAYLNSLKIPAGYIDMKDFNSYIQNFCQNRYGSANLIENVSNSQIFLNRDELKRLKLDRNTVSEELAELIIDYKNVFKVVTAKTLQNTSFSDRILKYLQNGYNQKLSGDVMIIPNPATIVYSKKGSTHGSGFSYDTHVPVLFYGRGIQIGSSKSLVSITDIAPTLANLLQISFPNGSSGNIIEAALK
jgi:predicted AlkP superfamily pyrophosphatase or phosphodiesterase